MLARSYLGSQALTAPLLKAALTGERADSVRRAGITAALAEVKSQIGEGLFQELLPVTADTFTSYFAEESKERAKERVQLQKAITAGANLQLGDKLRAEAKTDEAKALLNSCRAKGAALVFTTVPHSRHLELSREQVCCHERLHLGLPPQQRMPLHCACHKPNGQYAFDPWHALSCESEKATSVTDRHDDVKLALARWASRLGARVKIEPRRLDRNSKKRPDLMVEIAGQCFLIDVTVWHPLAPSHVSACARDEESVLKQAEAKKLGDYSGIAEDMKAEFFPFAVETTGRLGTGAMAFIKKLIEEGARYKNVWAPKEIVQGIYRSVAIAIARGNAEIIASNLQHSRVAAWDD